MSSFLQQGCIFPNAFDDPSITPILEYEEYRFSGTYPAEKRSYNDIKCVAAVSQKVGKGQASILESIQK